MRVIILGFMAIATVCAPLARVRAQSREELITQLNQAKKEYYEKKQAIDNEISELGRQWHMYQLQMHDEIKENPALAYAIRSELWEGAKKLSREKRALYKQLTPLRKQWYQIRMNLESQINELESGQAQCRN